MLRLKNLTLMGLLGISLAAAEKIPIASWSFDQDSGGDEVRGFQKIVDGVAGKALRFDGQTTAVAAWQGRPGRPDTRARGRRPRPLDPARIDVAHTDLDLPARTSGAGRSPMIKP
jgi:hypothetical protein